MGLLGDSLAAGTNETAPGPNGEQGWLEKRLAANLPWITHTRGGLRLADFVTGRHARSLAFFGQYCTSLVCELGSNDLYADGATLAVMQARAQSVWAEFSARGLPVWQSTITPRTTSTDNWATVANQTVASTTVEPVRTAFNDWLRAGWQAQGLAGLVEVADTVEVNAAGAAARNGGRWRIDKGQPTIDGTHPAGGLTDASVMGGAMNLSAFV